MAIDRVFLDWHSGLLERAVQWLLARYGPTRTASGEWNMQQVIVVLPTRHAIHQMQRLLERCAREAHCPLLPPRLETISRLPEQLYPAQRPLAGDLLQQAVWHQLLVQTQEGQLDPLYGATGPKSQRTLWELALRLKTLHAELAGEGFRFEDVYNFWKQHSEGYAESVRRRELERWQLLSDLQQRYLETTDSLGLWDPQTARLVAVEKSECRTTWDVVLVGSVDLNRTIRRMLEQVACRVTVLVFAPEGCAAGFDATGCLDVDYWCGDELSFSTDQLELVDGPAQQAERVGELLAAWAPRLGPDQVRVAVPDPALVPYLVRAIEDRQASVRWALGRPVSQTAPALLLYAALAFAQGYYFTDLAALVRHPDVSAWLTRQLGTPRWLLDCDRYRARHLVPRATLPLAVGPASQSLVASVLQLIHGWLSGLVPDRRPPQYWSKTLTSLLQTVYDHSEFVIDSAEHQESLEALSCIRNVLEDISHLPHEILSTLDLNELEELLFEMLSDHTAAPASDPSAIELLGWLDLPLDPAPYALVTTYNEGYIPESVNADLFLPNALRRHLGLLDNRRRLARDAYATRLLLESRKDVRFFVARRNALDEPLAPSRLALRGKPTLVVQRILRFYRPARSDAGTSPGPRVGPVAASTSNVESRFHVPAPAGDTAIDEISVTSLRDYLQCPYRFYLRHVLKLDSTIDEVQELDALAFGTLLHAVLRRFGLSPEKDQTEATRIEAVLMEIFEHEATERFGHERLPALQIQLAQLRRRLTAFAQWQSQWISNGWRIQHIEATVTLPVSRIPGLENVALQLIGRIDRIDRHEATGEWAVFDYKSSERAESPDQTHCRRVTVEGVEKREWVDLQLPAYRFLARQLGVSGTTQLGYINLPKDPASTRQHFASWGPKDLREADERLCQVLRAIASQQFWPPQSLATSWDDFAWICQETVLQRRLSR